MNSGVNTGEDRCNIVDGCSPRPLLALATGAANAQTAEKKINLKLSYWVPPSHLLTPGYKDWADEVTKLSNGSITVTLFPSSQLGSGPDHYDMAKRGIADFVLSIRAIRQAASR